MNVKCLVSLLIGFLFFIVTPAAWCDQWVTTLTPATVQTFNLNGVAGTYVTTTQAVVNPANCPAADGWVTVDPVISKEVLAMALSAVLAAHQIQIYVSSTQCANNRPMILDFTVNW